MAVIHNITPDARSVFSPDAPPAQPGDKVTVSDENFVELAWPTSIWKLVEPPRLKGYVKASTDEAHLWLPKPAEESTGDSAGGDEA